MFKFLPDGPNLRVLKLRVTVMAMTSNRIAWSLMLTCLMMASSAVVRAVENESVPKAPKSALEDPEIKLGKTKKAEEPIPSAPYYPTAAEYTVASLPVSSGPIISSQCGCGQCLKCVDRTDGTMIGGLGMKLGVGPCPAGHQCWQCPYDAPFNIVGPGEYAGPARTHRLPEYRLRTGDTLQLTFMVAPMATDGPYRLVVGDELLIEAEADEDLTRGTLEKGLKIQPDGTITLRLIGQVHAAGQTIDQLREVLEDKYVEFYPEPSIDVTPVNTGTAARQVREAISGAGGFDPQQIQQTLTPSGEIRLPKVGSVQAQGLTLDELKREINLRYDDAVGGLEVEPSLISQAAHNVFVLGEVGQPGRYDMNNTPTTVLGAIAMAGGHRTGANLRQVVVFRRGDNWELISTTLDLRGAILGREAHPCDEIWVRDGDVIILPSSPIRLFDNFVRQVFTEGLYGVLPISGSYNFGGSFNN
ncbi:polysaccharide biosynthesis/export family protein [Rubripirellula reticaptiva]|nr:polysaccharide biosynthesis/export family protein [Rubripirellula reticaptiva]